MTTLADPRPYRLPAIMLGIGLGGFFDGIVFHQLLQWHHLVSTPVPPTSLENIQVNARLDGAFHALAWLVTVMAAALFWRAARTARLPSWRYIVGGALVGWGGFNLVEGVVDHHLLNLHHVRPGADQLFWDLAFLGWGAVMAVTGWWLMRSAPIVVQTGGGPAR
jgi:uncharacterized membrane protein